MPPFTANDRTFLADPGTWQSGPTFDLIWDVADPHAEEALLDALRADPSVRPLPGARGRLAAGGSRLAWTPGPLSPVGLTVPCDGCPPPSVHAFIYPPHLERATGYGYVTADRAKDRRVHALFAAAFALTNRLHASVPLARARIFDEADWIATQGDGVILLHRWVAEAAGWDHEPSGKDGDLAALPLGVAV